MNYEEIRIGLGDNGLHEKIQIAIVNIPVLEHEVESSYLRSPITTRERLTKLTSLLNAISAHRTEKSKKIDLVIFPEVCLPHAWQAMIVSWARRHSIGVIVGIEHWIDNSKDQRSEARNEVLAALPYKSGNAYTSCVPVRRLKRYYSPEEIFWLKNEHLHIPREKDPFQLIRWRGASFAIYNCYELTSIELRSLFKGKVDFIVCTEFNRDVNYFSNIVESASRDLHCYIVQVNDSRYGDSRIVSPSASVIMNPLRIKGGDNLTFLTMALDLKALRIHQRKGYGLQKESIIFKPTPPGFKRDFVHDRINLFKKKWS
jgi:predicted amidohydrolase